MDKLDRIKDAIRYLMGTGEISKQQDIADRMRMKKATVSSALNGNEKYFTDSFIKKFNFAFSCMFDEDWLLKGVGPMLNDAGFQKEFKLDENSTVISADLFDIIKKQADSLERKDKQIDDLIYMLKEQMKENKKDVAPKDDNADYADAK